MKIKTTQIIKKLQPNAADFLVRVKNQQKLFNELVRRLEWKLVVLDHCDNYDDFSRATRFDDVYFDWRKNKYVIFPSKRCVSYKELSLLDKSKHLFHIIKIKKNRYKIVRIKRKFYENTISKEDNEPATARLRRF